MNLPLGFQPFEVNVLLSGKSHTISAPREPPSQKFSNSYTVLSDLVPILYILHWGASFLSVFS